MNTSPIHQSQYFLRSILLGAHDCLTGMGSRCNESHAGIVSRCFFALVLYFITVSSVLGAPYPKEGLKAEWMQPDGKLLSLRVYGDEFYGRTTTNDGYTVLFNSTDQTYYYSERSANGKSLINSGVRAHQAPPHGFAKHLKEPKDIVSAIRRINIQKYAPDRAANWAVKVNAVRLQREHSSSPETKAELDTVELAAVAALAAPISGDRIGLLILVQFPDDPATSNIDPINYPTSQSKMERFSNEVGYIDDGNTGSIRDYFYDQSNGQLTHTQSVTTIVTLPHPRDYYNYSDYPSNSTLADTGVVGRQLITDAIVQLQTVGFDFSSLSLDVDDRVYATSLLFAGNNSGVHPSQDEGRGGLWPHASNLDSQINVGTVTSPRYIYNYQITNVPDSAPVIGTISHELGHLLLSYPDFYDTDDSDGASEGVGEHSLMGSGNYLNGGKTPAPVDLYLKDISGWAYITEIMPTDSLDAALPSTGNSGYRIVKPGTSTEYFLVENRGFGDKWADYCPDLGIIIWHVDEAVTTSNQRQQMTASQHYELSIEQSDGQFDLEMDQNRGDSTDLFDTTTGVFNNDTNPDADWWDGTASSISIDVISAPGSSMNVRFSPNTAISPLVTVDPKIGHEFSGDASDISSTHTISLLNATTNCTTGVGDCTYSYRISGQSSADSSFLSGADSSSALGSVIFNFDTIGASAFDITVDVSYKGVVAVNSTLFISNPAGPAVAAPVDITSTGLGGLFATLNGASVPRGYSSSQLVSDRFVSTIGSVPAGSGSLVIGMGMGLSCSSDAGNGGECIAALGQQSELGWLNLNLTANPADPSYGIFVNFTFTPIAVPDQSPPVLTITSPVSNIPVNSSNVTLSGTATDAGQGDSGISSVTVNAVAASNGTATGANTANWSYNAALVPGVNNLTVIATDGSPAANQTTDVVTLTYYPFILDSDADGLDDSFEVAIGTNPNLSDTDGDGFSDGEEITEGTNPLDPVYHPLPDGDITGDGLVDVADLLLANRILSGQYTPTQGEQNRWDVAPLVSGTPQPDGHNNIGDYLVLLRKVMGAVSY